MLLLIYPERFNHNDASNRFLCGTVAMVKTLQHRGELIATTD